MKGSNGRDQIEGQITTLAAYLLFKIKAGRTNNLLVRLAYSYSIVLIVLIVFVLKVLINLYVRSEYWSGHGLTCLVSSPSHENGVKSPCVPHM